MTTKTIRSDRKSSRRRVPSSGSAPAAGPLAVIELGTTSVRMRVAQLREDGTLHEMDSLQQPVSLGKDSFTRGFIGPETTERCIRALRLFSEALKGYGVDPRTSLRAVATSAVREADNRQEFLDRIFVATGIDVQDLAPAEVSRFTYLAIQPLLAVSPLRDARDLLVVEVGGGSTDLLCLRGGRVLQAHVFRLGSLRLREMIERPLTSPARLREALTGYVDQGVRQIVHLLPPAAAWRMLALGGDARCAAEALRAPALAPGLGQISVSDLSAFADRILRTSPEDAARRHHLSPADADTLGPALLISLRLARALRLRDLWVGQASLRDGVLAEMAGHDLWSSGYVEEILASAAEVGKRFGVDAAHAAQVTRLARHFFAALRPQHGLSDRAERVLAVAALLHDIGLCVSPRSHHKHSLYLIQNSDIFGLNPREQTLAALVARYHRKAWPDPSHDLYADLCREDRVTVLKLAALLRVADALDCRHARLAALPQVNCQDNRLVIVMPTRRDLTMERLALQAKGDMLQRVYGLEVVLKNLEAGEG